MRDAIIRASIESLRQEGLKFSVDTLSDKMKISKKTVYKYLPDAEKQRRASCTSGDIPLRIGRGASC